MPRVADTALEVFPLCLGGNAFGWTADERQSFAVLDAYIAAGGNFIDTADTYSRWAEGNKGGESETIIGNWLSRRGRRDDIVIASKVGGTGGGGLSPDNIRTRAEASLRRLNTDYIDLYYAHRDDPTTPLEESLAVFDELVRAGKVRYVAASNYSAERLDVALDICAREGFASFVALQPHYNLVVRDKFEGALEAVCHRRGLACFPYLALASGFLTGKYRDAGDTHPSARAADARRYVYPRGLAVLAAVEDVACARATAPAAVAIAWLLSRPTVAAAIASARTVGQLADLIPAATLKLTEDELNRLSTPTEPEAGLD